MQGNEIRLSLPSKTSSRKLVNAETFTSILKNIIKLKLDIPCMQFKKKYDRKKKTIRQSEIYERVKYPAGNKCKEINTGENIMFNVAFTCQDLQPFSNYNNDEVTCERTDALRIEICFNYRNSISEFCKLANYGMKNEEEIINSLITIIDHDDHQVYFKLKTNYFNEEMEQLFRFMVIGKMDDSQHAFILDVSDYYAGSYTEPKYLKRTYFPPYSYTHKLTQEVKYLE